MHDHLVNHIHHPELRSDHTLHVIGVIFNPMRYHSRYRLFRLWHEAMKKTANVKVYVVELAFGNRQFEVTEADDPFALQLRTNQEIWHKESLINLAEKHLLPRDWKYMCWSDTDIFWRDPHWASETLHQLQHYPLVQPWRDCLDLGFQGTVLQHFQSFCYVHRLGIPKQCHPSQPYKYAHSGFAWACRRSWWEEVQKLIDFAILGSADHHMAFASINEVNHSIHGKMSDGFKKVCHDWQHKSYRACGGSLGFTPTRIEHLFHGKKRNRKYRERWPILYENHFDPITDLTYDAQGLVKLIGKPKLLEECREYFMERHEDEIGDY